MPDETAARSPLDVAIIREMAPAHLDPHKFVEWAYTKAAVEGCEPVDVAQEYAWSVING